ncbi:MAG: hypothetical protein UT50_C0005G0010 [Candidatus Moranbacteria bacterium GW2011_GWA2_39_41]|nr:MAG: hypothetical protein UT50_C0005G0010 [Candidatus Moranbacteria bacterium GW2011_GWA2_39_41]
MDNNLSKYVLTTLAYYDVMDYPMTAFEIWKYLTVISNFQFPISNNQITKYSLTDVVSELEDDKLQKFVEEFQGYYFLRGRRDLVEQRIERNKIAEQKFRIVQKVVFWLRFVPFVRGVAVTGRLAMKNTEFKSDLDFLVVLKKGRIFTGRTLVTLMVHLLGKRRYGQKINNRVCLNYFITNKSLEINLKDVFSASEYSFIVPIFGRKTFKKFQWKNNWIMKYKPNYQAKSINSTKLLHDSQLAKTIRKAGEKLLAFDFIEQSLKKWQTKRIMNDPRTKQAGSMIVANDDSLVFLPNPQSSKVFEKFQERLAGLK